MMVLVALNMPANLENSATATRLEKVSFHSNSKDRRCQKCSNYHTIALISHTSKVMLKILQARLQQYVAKNIQMYQVDLKEGEEPQIKLPTFAGLQKKQENFRKPSISASLTTLKPFTLWITINCGKFFKRWEYQTTCPAS